jgi:steroid 5-alpha reductase family enzyme
MYDKKGRSLGAKLYIAIIIFIATLIPSWLMIAEANDIIVWLKPYKIQGDLTRQIILISCLGLYFLRILLTLFVFMRRKVRWIEAIIISPCYLLMFYWFAYSTSDKSYIFGTVVIIGILLYLIGSYLNTYSEYSRHIWKKQEKNKDHLYTEGLFRYSMHINYFGDSLLFIGLAMITENITSLLIPAIVIFNYLTVFIPKQDRYLQKRYREELEQYARRTKKFIPFLY